MGLQGKRERGVDATSERGVEAHAPVPHLVAESLDDQRPIVGHRPGRSSLVVQVPEQVLDRQVVEAGALAQPRRGGVGADASELADHLAQRREGPLLAKLPDPACALRSADDPSDGDDAVANRVLDHLGRGPDPEHFHDASPVKLRGPR